MSMSLRDQLLQAGLISQKQAREAERQEQQRERTKSVQKRGAVVSQPGAAAKAAGMTNAAAVSSTASTAGAVNASSAIVKSSGAVVSPVAARATPVNSRALSAKVARDQALNRKQHEKALKKAQHAQIKQLLELNRLPDVDGEEPFNFLDGNKIRRIAINGASRASLTRGDLCIVRHEGRYYVVLPQIAARVAGRDPDAVIATQPQAPSGFDDAYPEHAVPDDLIW